MPNNTILILGGYGSTGKPIAGLLLKHSEVDLIIAGRSKTKGNAFANDLNRIFSGQRVTAMVADAAKLNSLRSAFAFADFVVVASSTAQYVENVATAAIEAQIGYLDVQHSAEKLATLKAMQPQIEQAGCCFITDGGFHPGLPAALIRAVASEFDQLERAVVSSVIQIDWRRYDIGRATMVEFVGELGDYNPLIYRDGEWQAGSMSKPLRTDFGSPFGVRNGVPYHLEEMRGIPALYPEIAETGFYVGSFNWFSDWIVMPLATVGLRIAPRLTQPAMGRLLMWSLRAFSKPPYGTVLQVEVIGVKDNRPKTVTLSIGHEDGYVLTAIPVVACLLQLLDGTIGAPGLWWQALIVEPQRFLADMAHMGAVVQTDSQAITINS